LAGGTAPGAILAGRACVVRLDVLIGAAAKVAAQDFTRDTTVAKLGTAAVVAPPRTKGTAFDSGIDGKVHTYSTAEIIDKGKVRSARVAKLGPAAVVAARGARCAAFDSGIDGNIFANSTAEIIDKDVASGAGVAELGTAAVEAS